jgi:Bifunctional DNA primase/polymerase, N-terminal
MPTVPSRNRDVREEYRVAGVPVFPVGPDKLPLFKWRPKGKDGGTRPLTGEEAEALWRLQRARDAMLGLDCQALRVIVVDLDAKNGGPENFEALCREHGINVGAALVVRTATGGVHLTFADPEGRWRNSTGKLATGVDTRGKGGYVVAAGTLRYGVGIYEPVRPASLTEFIDHLASERLAAPPKPLADLLDAYCLPGVSWSAIRRPTTTIPAGLIAALPRASTAMTATTAEPTMPQSSLFDGQPGNWDELTAGVPESWTLRSALRQVAAAVPGTRNDTFARQAFTAGLRASALALDPDRTVDALIEAAGKAGSDDDKTTDTITRCFNAGMARADADAASIATAGAAPPAAFAPPRAIELAITKAKAADAYKLGRLKSREQARVLLARFCKTVAEPEIKRELAKSVAALMAADGWPRAPIASVATFLGLGPADASLLAQWAVRKNFGRGARA